MNRKTKKSGYLLLLMLLVAPMTHWAQQPRLIKVSEFNISDIPTIEDRVFVLHSIIDKGYYCFNSPNSANIIEVYVTDDAPDEFSDFDFYYDNVLYEQLNDFGLNDKATRGNLFVQWRQTLDDELFKALYQDFNRGTRADNATCETALPFCTDNGLYNFPAGVDAGSPCPDNYCDDPYHCTGPHQGQDNCLSTAPNPAFYFMRIDEPGNLNIHMYSTPSHDIDFDCWGPFDDINTACDQLSCSTMVDCSYDPSATEDCHINNAQTGQYYILLITNYSNQTCNINFENTGTGTTDCDILPPLVNNDGPYCEGQTIHLSANGQPGTTYSWTGPNNFSSNEQNPTIPNCTPNMAGDYICTITMDSQSNNATTSVEIYPLPTPSFSATTVCQGEPTVFTGTASVPDISDYEWDFGDNNTGSGANISHTYEQAGTYQVTLTTSNGDGLCSDQVTQTVTVNAMPVPTATANPGSVDYNGVSTLTAQAGAEGSFTYHWEPANMVVNPNSQTTQTVGIIETQVYTVTVTNTQGGCTSSAQVTVVMGGSNMTATATADEYEICEGSSTTLHAHPVNGTGSYTYSWSPANTLSGATIQNPVASPSVGTTVYTCTVSDGIVAQDVNVTIIVHPNREKDIYDTICDNEFYPYYGQNLYETGIYTHTLETIHHCDSLVRLHLQVNSTKADEITMRDSCDVASMEWFGETIRFRHDCDSVLTGVTPQGCHWERTVHVRDMEYTPAPSIRYADDPFYHDGHTIAVVTNTEFFSFNYDFYVEDANGHINDWDACVWQISKESWVIEPFTDPTEPDRRYCKVYVAERDEELVELTATVSNGCGEATQRFYLKSSFFDVDENGQAQGNISIVPNPNNGKMRLDFENMEGRTSIKIFDMTGSLIDAFETNVNSSRQSLDYNLSQRAEGLYFFVISNNDYLITKKVVIIP